MNPDLNKSDINLPSIFYHGISIEMTFASTFATFCSPTSTTSAIMIAFNFAKKGMLLELKNGTPTVVWSCFSCALLSCYSNEEEYLFIGGGCDLTYMNQTTSVPSLQFSSIRNLRLKRDYKVFVQPISMLHQMLTSSIPTSKTTKRSARYLQAIFDDYLLTKNGSNNYGNNNNSNIVSVSDAKHIPPYIRSLFKHFCLGIKRITFCIPVITGFFTPLAPIFCKFYSDEVMHAKSNSSWMLATDHELNEHINCPALAKGFINPVYSLDYDKCMQLFPNVSEIETGGLPLTHALMKDILSWLPRFKEHYPGLKRICVEDAEIFYEKQMEFDDAKCEKLYKSKFKDAGFKLVSRSQDVDIMPL
jgi:hypothetical protein